MGVERPITATGSAVIAAAYVAEKEFAFDTMTLHLSAAPVTAGDIVVTLTAAAGAAYNTVIDRIDPAANALTDYVLQPDRPIIGGPGDGITVAYANADSRTYGLRLVVREARVQGVVPEVPVR